MVSPYKKKKIDKKSRVPSEPSSPKNYIGARRLKSSKPLSNKKFYLDIKNNGTLKQIEAKLTALGASLELFLVKDVFCVVTDRDDYPRHTTRHLGLVTPSPFSISVSPATTATDSPTDGVISKRTRSRAEAMLEKARQQPQRNTTIDSLENAVAWKIPIYNITKFQQFLEKLDKKRSEPCVRELRGHYLKVETGTGRPDFRLLKTWPKLCYSDDEPAAFPPPKPLSKHDPQRMTRKVGKAGKDGSTAPGGGNGYCEICRVHYDQLDTHLSSSQHIKLVSDPVHYSQLDSLIAQHDLGSLTSLRKSLRIAKSPPVEMGTKHSMEAAVPQTTMNGHVTRSKTDKILSNGLSPIDKRKEKKDPKLGNLEIKLERIEILKDKEKDRERERDREREKEREKEQREKERERDKTKDKEREREKEKLREKEREREKEKLREREKEKIREREREKIKEREREKEKEKIREKEREKEKERLREREREREKEKLREKEKTFREKTKEREKELDRIKETERLRTREIERGRDKTSSEEERSEGDHNLRSRHSAKAPTPQSKRAKPSRKRLSVEEKLIEDNRSYYKVEVLNSKLRSTELYLTQQQAEQARVNGGPEENCPEDKEEIKEPVVVRFRKVRKTQLAVLSDEAENFMFGDLTRREARAAYSESSDDSRGESDSSEEEEILRKKKKINSQCSENHERERRSTSPKNKNLHSFPTTNSCDEDENSDDEPLITLNDISFSFEKPPKNEPWMENYKPEGKEFYFPHYHEYPINLLPYEYPPAERMKLLSGKRGGPGGFRKRGERFSKLLEDGKPRKSPRCHASTLAIMSSLMRRRPMRECTTNLDFTYEEESRSSLPDTVDTSSTASDARLALPLDAGPPLPIEPSGDAYAIALARLACGETNSFQVTPGPCLPVDPAILSDPPPGIECPSGLSVPLIDLIDQNSQPIYRLLDFDLRYLEVDSGSDCSDLIGFGEDGRGVSGRRRKRKRNLTGWPVGKPRKRIIRKEEDATVIKCEPCEIKLEPIDQDVIDQFSFKDVPVFEEDSLSLPVIPIKRGRGRPRKFPLLIPPSSFSSPPLSPKSSPKKNTVPRFTFSPRRSCLK